MVGYSAHAHGLGARISSVQLQVSSVQLPVRFSFGMAEQEGTPLEGTLHGGATIVAGELLGESVEVGRDLEYSKRLAMGLK